MQLHELRPDSKQKQKKRVGRGGKRGTYSGHGIKGQSSRAGRKFQPQIRMTIKRYHKKRGYKFKSIKQKPLIINLSCIEKEFQNNDKINPNILIQRRLASKIKGRIPEIKILGNGNLTKKLLITGCAVSKKAKEKIEKMKGEVRNTIIK